MRAATYNVAAFYLNCPMCRADIPNPENGSFLWPTNMQRAATVECPDCRAPLKVPARAFREE